MSEIHRERRVELSEAFIDRTCRDLAADSLVRHRLPGWGRLHIDRRQPFLCVYRKPPDREDPGTGRLLQGQASYLLASGAADLQAALGRLVGRLAETLAASFGAVALLELWAAPKSRESSDRNRLRIVAPEHDAPLATLEAIERAVLETGWPEGAPEIAVDYQDSSAPAGLPPLIDPAAARALRITPLGLEIAPLYRDWRDGELLPVVLDGTRHAIGHVLKQGFYAFSHAQATYRPAHYHELGRRAMTRAVWSADRSLAVVADSFDLILHATPVNAAAAWRAFRAADCQRTPEFHYRPQRVDPATLKRALYKVPLERIEDPTLHHLFAEKRDELDRQITMLGDRGTPRFLPGSLQVFGADDGALRALAHGILARIPPPAATAEAAPLLDAAAFAARAERELDHYRTAFPELPAGVQVRADVTGLIASRGQLLVGEDAAVPEDRVDATLQHEIGTHILTYYNGVEQPFQQFHAGMPGYEELQEGIAVLAEYLVGGLSPRRLRQLAGRVLAVHGLTAGAGFVDTYRSLTGEHGFAPATAYTTAMRVHRGGGLTKDVVYLRGLARLLAHLGDGGALEDLLLGKLALHHVDLVDELKWRRVLKPARLRARYLDRPAAMARLRRLAEGRTVLDLAEEVGR